MPNQLLKIFKNGLLPLLLGFGLFFINIKSSHDWGDDFAQYLQEAENISQGRPLGYSSFKYNPDFTRIGPQLYPPGFPLLLNISKVFNANEIVAGQYLITAFLILFGWMAFLLLIKHKVPWLAALLLALTLIYHPWAISQKTELLSDIPFAFFFLASIVFFGKGEKVWTSVMAGVLAGFAISIRSAGWTIPLSSALLIIYYFRHDQPKVKKHISFIASAILSGTLINGLLGYYSARHGYSSLFKRPDKTFSEAFTDNLDMYISNINLWLETGGEDWHFAILIIEIFFWVSLIVGWIKLKEYKLPALVAAMYALLIILFPYNGGQRFLIPLLPLVLLIAYKGSEQLFKRKTTAVVWICLLIGLNIQYQPMRAYIQSQEKSTLEGPQQKESQEMISYIKSHLGDGDLIIFSKPRALGYYTKVKSTATLWEIHQAEFTRQTESLGATHFLVYTEIEYFALNDYVEENSQNLKILYQNKKFILYSKLKE